MVRFNTVLDAKLTQEANKHQLKKLWWLYAIVIACFTYLGVDEILSGYVYTGVFIIVIGLLFVPLVIWFTKIFQKRINKSMSIISTETKEEYQFYDDHVVIIQTKGEDFKATTETKYNYFFQIVETKTHYLMYISKVQVHVIDKTKITEGTLEELNEILRKQMKEGSFKEYKGD